MSDLIEFLLARYAEDEAVARQAISERDALIFRGPDDTRPMVWDDWMGGPGIRMGAEALLAECEAKRRIVKRHSRLGDIEDDFRYQEAADSCTTCGYGDTWEAHEYGSGWPCPTIKDLASVYADHPDYRQEWKP